MTAANNDTKAFQHAADDLENLLAAALGRLDQRNIPRVWRDPRIQPAPPNEESEC